MAPYMREKKVRFYEAPLLSEPKNGPTRRRYRHGVLAPLILLGFLFYCARDYFYPAPTVAQHGEPVAKDISRWGDVPVSAELDLRPCFKGHLCARLEVPLDWNATDLSSGTKATIAIMLRPAEVNVTDARHGGALMWNPGGPGGPATPNHQMWSEVLHNLVDTPGEKYFDVISFDPRGVYNTEPRIKGLEDPVLRQSWLKQIQAVGVDLSDSSTFHNVWARYKLYGNSIAQSNAEAESADGHPGQFVSTAVVVRDMVEILEQYGRWREKKAREELRSCEGCDVAAALERTRYRPGEEKINYWGFSYGTVLGQVFAVLQPHRVQRMVLDGTVDLKDWVAGGWSRNIQDTEKITQAFAAACVEAGPDRCAIADWSSDGHVSLLLRGYYGLMEQLKRSPITTIHPATGQLTVTTFTDVIMTIFALWYTPVFGFPYVANFLDGLSRGDTSLDLTQEPLSCALPSDSGDYSAAQPAIHCSDGPDRSNTTEETFQDYLAELRTQSPLFADGFSTVRMPCTGFSVRPKWRFEGPFGASTPVGILFADQSLDPVTPLANGEAAAKRFPGAGVLEAKGYGHCTISLPNLCAIRVIQKYFLDGETHPDKIVCPQETNPFDPPQGLKYLAGDWAKPGADLRDVAWAASETWTSLRRKRWETQMFI